MIKNKNTNPPVSDSKIAPIDFFDKIGNKGVFLPL
jgi:hypothetical protein